MPVTKPNDFWKLILESGLMTKETCKPLHDQYQQTAQNGDVKALATWLIKGRHLTAYQARVLLAGRPKILTIGEYQVSDRIESGPLQGTLISTHQPTGQPVWLHPIAPEIQEDSLRFPIVQRMCQLRSAAPHPHLIRCFHLREGNKRSHLVTEQLDGNLLAESRPGEGIPIPAPDCARLCRQAALGATQLHGQGMVVGDFSLDQLWLEATGNLKLLHLPVRPVEAIAWSDPSQAARLETLANVAAPELQQPGAAPSKLSDLYALGAIMFDLLTGKPLFQGSLAEKLQQHAGAPVPTPPYIPADLMQILQYLLAKNPAGRYQSAADVAEALRPFVDATQLSPPLAEVPSTLGNYLQHLAAQNAPAPAPQPTTAQPPTAAPFPTAAPVPQPPGAQPPLPQPPMPQPVPPPGMPQPVPPQAAPFPGVPNSSMPQPAVPTATPVGTAQPPIAIAVPVGAPTADGGTGRASMLAERIRKRKRQRKITSIVVLCLMAIATVVGGYYGYGIVFPPDDIANNGTRDPVQPNGNPETKGPSETELNPAPTTPSGPKLVEDDGQTLWASPTSGEAIDLSGLPNDTRLALVVRTGELTATPEGERILRALGPQFAAVRSQLEGDLALEFNALESLTVGLGASTSGGPACIVAKLKETTNLPSLWGNPTPVAGSVPPMYQVNGWTVLPIPGQEDKAFVAGSSAVVQAVATQGVASPQLTRELEQLRRESDNQQTVSLLVDPQFLASNTAQVFPGELSAAATPVQDFLGEGLRGILLSGHMGSDLYLEMRLIGSLSLDPPSLAANMKEKIMGVSRSLEESVMAVNPTSYWRRLATQFPSMVRFAYQNTRSGVEDDQAMINCILPASAGQNLVAASELLLAANMSGAAAPAGDNMPASKKPETIEEKLASTISISFPQNSLEFALRDIGEQAGIPVEINGNDLQLDGITRNKEIKDFHFKDKPVGEILAQLMVRANPEASPGPGTDIQKLIFVIHPTDGPDEAKKLVVTTRKAAEREKYTLPEVFQIK
ncbi:serine/threonine protein kinase [Blastopirellula marina]|uniref:Protein kinase domain-containing protein n=1 Tax=Blastopirellula marina TaxID=124 RepID=A0A2S8FCS1_9BACT|nr:hypothetical protein [Blastopirellula marina]PQO29963.1 hypothetical protein C5Y98_22135 [Blastopirellula marina]PTL42431.1 hypothetical protein C5Y97_22145 [Blastopirellula marina]